MNQHIENPALPSWFLHCGLANANDDVEPRKASDFSTPVLPPIILMSSVCLSVSTRQLSLSPGVVVVFLLGHHQQHHHGAIDRKQKCHQVRRPRIPTKRDLSQRGFYYGYEQQMGRLILNSFPQFHPYGGVRLVVDRRQQKFSDKR
jgi:hypothetical protein